MELHFIAADLEEHAWYQELAADMIEQVELYLRYLSADLTELEEI